MGLGKDYNSLVSDAVTLATSGERIFCGPVDDPFFVDLGGIFDLGNFRKEGARDGVAKFNCHSIVIEVPVSNIQKENKSVAMASSMLDPDFVIGVYASSSRRKITTLNSGSDIGYDGEWVQVSRLGMPLTNEAIIPIGMKDKWNATSPANDLQFAKYFTNPELALYMDDDQFGKAVPGLEDLRIQSKSLGAFDFRNGKPGLFSLKGTDAVKNTALAEEAFGKILLPDNASPRAVDLLPIFYTGVPNLPPYQLATGKDGNPLAAGKPFINNFLPTLGDYLRLNMAVPATPRDDPKFSTLGLVGAAVLGLTDPAYNADKSLQWIPNMDGFPNGRRLEDDVTTIELQAVSGVVLAAIGLWYDDYQAGMSPVTPMLGKVLGFNAGVTKNDTTFKANFPYLQNPWPGFRGKSYEGVKAADMQPLAIAITNFDCLNGTFTITRTGGNPSKEVEFLATGVIDGDYSTKMTRTIEPVFFKDNTNTGDIFVFARYVGMAASEISIKYDFRAACGFTKIEHTPGRSGIGTKPAPLSAVVMGNPSTNDEVVVEIRGAFGKRVQMDLVNSRGQVFNQQVIAKAGENDRRLVKLSGQTGIYYLKVTTPQEKYTVKILRK